ncbi:MAG: Ribonuclease H [candidate division BRC1 bacterium ADurb.BinA364]|nr:MAG: Ribonuclease H [candidate division BRC1 bacterium ADurb.BinA364]
MEKPLIIVYTDGSCQPNPGAGGWAAVLIAPGHENKRKEISGAEARTTNNRMELTAAIRALEALKRPCRVELHTDSQYLKLAFTDGWLEKWQRNGWKTASRAPVLNEDLWRRLLALESTHEIQWKWVRGHADNQLNERCDELAAQARDALGPAPSKGRQPRS